MISPERIERLDELYAAGYVQASDDIDADIFCAAIADAWPDIRDALRARAEVPEDVIVLANNLRNIARAPIAAMVVVTCQDAADRLESLSRRAAELEAENALLRRALEMIRDLEPSLYLHGMPVEHASCMLAKAALGNGP